MTPKLKGKPVEAIDNELRQALTVLSRPDADESAVDQALETLMQTSRAAAPPRDFARRVMTAVHQAALPEGRVPLEAPRAWWPRLAAFGLAAAMVAWAALATFGPLAASIFAAAVAFVVRTGLSAVAAVRLALEIWSTTATTSAALANALASPAGALGLAATMLVGTLSFAALTQLLSTKQEPSPWHDTSSFV